MQNSGWDPKLPTIFAITPTYRRFLQKAELTRTAQTLKHVKNLHWIVVEDSHEKTNLVKRLLNHFGIRYTHLNVRTPVEMRIGRNKPRWTKSRGTEQRNLGLEWIRDNMKPNETKGVVYFADDDNTYDLRLFDEVTAFSSFISFCLLGIFIMFAQWKLFRVVSPYIRESTTFLDYGFQILVQCLSEERGFWIPVVGRIWDTLSCIPDSKVQDPGFHKENFPGFRRVIHKENFPDSLTGASSCYIMKLALEAIFVEKTPKWICRVGHQNAKVISSRWLWSLFTCTLHCKSLVKLIALYYWTTFFLIAAAQLYWQDICVLLMSCNTNSFDSISLVCNVRV